MYASARKIMKNGGSSTELTTNMIYLDQKVPVAAMKTRSRTDIIKVREINQRSMYCGEWTTSFRLLFMAFKAGLLSITIAVGA